MDTNEQLKRIQEKTQLLLKKYAAAQKENHLLVKENLELKDKIEQKETITASLQQQVDVLKYSSGKLDEQEKALFEKRINAYIKEIERCIALLSK